MAGRRRVGQRQPDVQRHDPGLRPRARQRQQHRQRGRPFGRVQRADGGEAVIARRPGQHPEGQQKANRAEARHQKVDPRRAPGRGLPVVGEHQHPGGHRHELPRHQEHEGVRRDQHEVHARDEERERRQHGSLGMPVPVTMPVRRPLVSPAVEARGRRGEVDHHQEQRRQPVHRQMRAQPRQPHGQHQRRGLPPARQPQGRPQRQQQRNHPRPAMDKRPHPRPTPKENPRRGQGQQQNDGGQDEGQAGEPRWERPRQLEGHAGAKASAFIAGPAIAGADDPSCGVRTQERRGPAPPHTVRLARRSRSGQP